MAPAIASIDPGPFCIDKVANVAIGSYGAGINSLITVMNGITIFS